MGSRYISARFWDELSRILVLALLGNDDIDCENRTEIQRLECSDGESCLNTVLLRCGQCATSASRRDAEAESHKSGGGLTIGGIIGGVIGSIVITSVATYLVWRFYIKPKRSQTSTSIHIEAENPVQSSEDDAARRGASLPSTHTVHSMAPTILTRASNIIQVAQFPNIINQATLTSPNP
ncbi:hypothetical protein Focb16_v004087 [Fusarium oxysporum f. sp. cubense]|uniref:Membrane anchor Opy2 N-terminal domain-containing protein n=1 Tax=Fusarium oxysporum f. sp. cubense TaxID=61366 RepID=A0A559KSA1_FUSOC|nr:hypothetical protein Focb16_v004087 [Fusarium oxysporum f. sp. cubense]